MTLIGTLASALALVAGCGAGGPPSLPPSVPSTAAGPPPAPAAPAPSPVSCEDTVLGRLDARARAAQLVMVGVPADGVTPGAREALARSPGGIILTDPAHGGDPSLATVTRTVRTAKDAAGPVPPLVATDQEGGKVQDLAGAGFSRIPTAEDQGRDPGALRGDAAGWGHQLAAAGVSVDLAPVADVVDAKLGRRNAPVGALGRGYGTEPGRVGAAITAFVAGMGDAGVATTLKHFPGLGAVRQNTDFAGGVTDTSTASDGPGMDSFRAGVRAGAGLVMMSSARYTAIDPSAPALFSPTVMDRVLRRELGFDGVIMTDDVGAATALANVPVAERATRFVAAGGNLVLTVTPSDATPMVTGIAARARTDAGFRERVDDSARRVLRLKVARGLVRC